MLNFTVEYEETGAEENKNNINISLNQIDKFN